MKTITIEEIMAQQEQDRADILENSDRGGSAWELASMALRYSGSGSEAAAKLLLAMEHGKPFNFELLLRFDSTNRAHADLVLMGYRPHELWPSKWMNDAGIDGAGVMRDLLEKWG